MAAKAIWFPLMMAVAWLSVWLATSIGGARRTLESAAWSFVAIGFYLPVFDAAWNGNVGTILGLLVVLVALGGTVAGVSAGLATLLKVSPGPLVLVALVAGRRSAISVIVTLLAVAGVSFALAPEMWFEYPRVLLNMVAGEGDYASNVAPVQVASRLGLDGVGLTLTRLASLVVGASAVFGAVWAARRPGGLPLAVLLASAAMLIVPGTLWYHYFAVVLPLVAMAWPKTSSTERVILVVGAAVSSIAISPILPIDLTLIAAVVMLAIAGRVLWASMPNLAEPVEGA